MITRLAHINIVTADLAATERFYCDILGMTKAFDFVKNGVLCGFYLAVGETTFIEVFHDGGDLPNERPLLRHFCLEVADIDALIAAVRGKGWQISDKTFGADKAWQAWLNDPSGIAIEVMQYTPASNQFSGDPCVLD
ncbi:MAG TPA: VOC family protein [Aggregatilineales bacterium]|nr:VOC family protein [Anaerolineales bacterium]HRE46447.1 VOC family protein [Aggregatilineales bacterium]